MFFVLSGISQESGFPTFRDLSVLWEELCPLEVFKKSMDNKHRKRNAFL